MTATSIADGGYADRSATLHAGIQPAYTSWTRRIAAAVLDGGIGGGAAFLALGTSQAMVRFIDTYLPLADGQNLSGSAWTDSGWLVGTVLVVFLMQAYLGATPGKLVVGQGDARPIGAARTAMRWFAHLLDAILMIGYLRPLWNARRQTFGDSIVSSVVLSTRRPRPHRRFAGDPTRDPGPALSWEAPSARRWWPTATVLAAVACGLEFLYAVGPSSTSTIGGFEAPCAMRPADDGSMGLNGGTVTSDAKLTMTARASTA
jgi:Mce-associated membrane protein